MRTGEPFRGDYIIDNGGPPFRALIFVICGKYGFEKDCENRGIEPINTGRTKHENAFYPCNISQYSLYCNRESFSIPGVYNFEVIIYNCTQIEMVLNISCDTGLSRINSQKIRSSLQPLVSVNKTITVI